MMRRYIPYLLWIGIALVVLQAGYFFLAPARPVRHDEGTPLTVQKHSVPIRNIATVISDGNDTVWIGTEGQGLFRYQPSTQKTERVPAESGPADEGVTALALDQDGLLWVGTVCHGVSVHDGTAWKNYDVDSGPLGEHVVAIRVCPVDGDVWLATNHGLTRYRKAAGTWSHETCAGTLPEGRVSDLAFDAEGNAYLGTACHGIVTMNRNAEGEYRVAAVTVASERFGTPEAPNVSPVPLDAYGQGLPSNRINAMLCSHDGTVWAATDTGLAWSRDRGETWSYLRGRNYGEKMRGLTAGAPPNWTEISRKRFGELLPEDDLTTVSQDAKGTLWIGTRSLGCININPAAFYVTATPGNKSAETAMRFLEAMAVASKRFFGMSEDQVVAVVPIAGDQVLVAGRSGSLEQTEGRAEGQRPENVPPRNASEGRTVALPQPVAFTSPRELIPKNLEFADSVAYPYAVNHAEDWKTQGNWWGSYGRDYALVGGADASLDRLIAFDESLCRIRVFAGNVGNRTRPIERITVHTHGESPVMNLLPPEPKRQLTAWRCLGDGVPRDADGPHLWCSVELREQGLYRFGMYFVDSTGFHDEHVPRDAPASKHDHLISIYQVPENWEHTIDWTELGKRAEDYAVANRPLAKTRVRDFTTGVHQQFLLAGPGIYLVRVDKNFRSDVELTAVMVDRMDQGEASPGFAMTPVAEFGKHVPPMPDDPTPEQEAVLDLWNALDHQMDQRQDAAGQYPLRIQAFQAAAALLRKEPEGPQNRELVEALAWRLNRWNERQATAWNKAVQDAMKQDATEQTVDEIPE